jgi:hypothetical protein
VTRPAPAAVLVLAFLVLATCHVAVLGQIPYDSGQNVVPVFEGWQRNGDGSKELWFGYYNRNYKEELDLPVGDDNGFDGGLIDRGQPTHFYPRRHFFVFAVRVPGDWEKKELAWTLNARGRIEKAFASLNPQWEVDAELIAKNKGGATLRLDLIKNDQPPSLTIDPVRPVTLPGPARLLAQLFDDGLPRPARGTPRQVARDVLIEDERPHLPPGLTVRWTQYRGPGRVTFDPAGPAAAVNGPVSASAAFSAPGTYELRATASDGLLETHQNVIVTVTPHPQ